MEFYDIVQGTLYFIVTFTGVLGNALILVFLLLIAYQEGKQATSEVILSHLAAVNLIIYLTRTLPSVLFKFGLRNIFDDVSCKVATLIFRVSRGMTIGLTCLLSCFQFAIISGSNKRITEKQKIHRCVAPVITVLYVTNAVTNIDAPIFTTAPYNLTDLRYVFNPGFCIVVYPGKLVFDAKGYVTVAMDVFLVIVMSLASCRMLVVLYRHRKKMQDIRGPEQGQAGAESQAAKTVVMLVSCYAVFFGIDNALRVYQTAANKTHIMVSDIHIFFTMCYGSMFPVILLIFNKKIQNQALHVFSRKTLKQLRPISYCQRNKAAEQGRIAG
ncbi:olfactory receptor class A-like protein 1 [Ambystoma mexicanum]|uniref:olfactory receptor class A-like protein 1 n=1 Tax=Ambystoma mexicanum TaxID=8296 RepID=UPI0037E89942